MDNTSPMNMNGADIVAHDPLTGNTYVRLPEALWRPAGPHMCLCPACEGKTAGYWDALVVPTRGTAWTVHLPMMSIPMLRNAIAEKVADKRASRKSKRTAKVAPICEESR